MTEYHPSFAARARDMCFLGASEAEISKLIGVSVSTLKRWREVYPDFDYAWTDGIYHANMKVAAAMHKRACGYEVVVWKETQFGMMRELKHIEPSVPAGIFWLTNKCPEQWRSRVEHEIAGGGTIPLDVLSEVEAARRIAFALSKAIYESGRLENGNANVSNQTIQPGLGDSGS